MNVLNSEIINIYDDWDSFSISRLFQEEENKDDGLAKLPYDIFDHLSKYLSSRDRKNLAMVCKPIYQYSVEFAIYREFKLIQKTILFLNQNLNQKKYRINVLKLKNLYDKLELDKFKYRYENLGFKEKESGIEEARGEIDYVKSIESKILKIRNAILNLLENVEHNELDKLKNCYIQESPRFFENLFDIARIRRLNVEENRPCHFTEQSVGGDWVWGGNFKVLDDLLQKYPVPRVLEIASNYFNGEKKDFAIYQLFVFTLKQFAHDLNENNLKELIGFVQKIRILTFKKSCVKHILSALFLKSRYAVEKQSLFHCFKIETAKVVYVINSVFTDMEIRDFMIAKLSFDCKIYFNNRLANSFSSLEEMARASANLDKAKELALSISDESKRTAVLLGLEDKQIKSFDDLRGKTTNSIYWSTSPWVESQYGL